MGRLEEGISVGEGVVVIPLGLCSKFEGITWTECLSDPSPSHKAFLFSVTLRHSSQVINVAGRRRET